MSNHFLCTCPPTEIETKQFIRALGRRATHPQTDEQTGNQRHVDLELYPILPVTEEMPTAQDPFKPAAEQFHGPPITVRESNEVRV